VGYIGSVSEHDWQAIFANLATAAARAGFDLVQAFSVAHYNAAAPATERLDDLGRAALPGALGVVFGNTRELWPVFTSAYAQDAALAGAEHPLDAYVVTRLTSLLAEATSARSQLVFAHVTTPRAFPIQRLAERVGLASLSPSHLAIHPLHGPWLALRAVAVIDVAGPSGALPAVARPCLGCSAPCLPALEQALLVSGEPLSSAAIARHAGDWIAVRDACPVGRGSRYGANQLAYHYTPAHSRIRPES
jgi:methylmalonic aciduria homocystinuria type C protein